MSEYNIGSNTWPGLSKLIEEMGEVGQVVGKILGTGGVPNHWDGTNLVDRLHEELADLEAAIQFVKEINGLDLMRCAERRAEKVALFYEWHEAQSSKELWGQGWCYCRACGHRWVQVIRMSEDLDHVECPNCNETEGEMHPNPAGKMLLFPQPEGDPDETS